MYLHSGTTYHDEKDRVLISHRVISDIGMRHHRFLTEDEDLVVAHRRGTLGSRLALEQNKKLIEFQQRAASERAVFVFLLLGVGNDDFFEAYSDSAVHLSQYLY